MRAVPPALKQAIRLAANNIRTFHRAQRPDTITVATAPGVVCRREARPIERVGIYIPGGSAPLVSTVLMLGIPARLAGCRQIILCTPPQKNGGVPSAILYAARCCGINQIFAVGGAQAIAALAYGTQTIPKVDKIFGPGNRYVTMAKLLVAADPTGAAIDLPAGPSEVLVIADGKANAAWVAADLLAQAEHSADARAILVCPDKQKVKKVMVELNRQLAILPRRQIAAAALKQSFVLITSNVEKAIAFANFYAPEHLALNIKNPRRWRALVKNAGAVFLGVFSPVTAGDYASGANHTLPTAGAAKAWGGVSLENFLKFITCQEITRPGLRALNKIIEPLTAAEELAGHQRAIQIRLSGL